MSEAPVAPRGPEVLGTANDGGGLAKFADLGMATLVDKILPGYSSQFKY